ncbi:MAG: hypothetical protein JJT95_03205 [Pararhodobacter sp.]|nr:hypothetical protein [Pararhodobacter sp.]
MAENGPDGTAPGTARLPLRHLLRQGTPVGLMWFSIGAPALIEIALEARGRAGCGASNEGGAIVIDAQHGLWSRSGIEAAIGAVAGRMPVLVRVADHGATGIAQALDAGAEGVIVPLVETAAQAVAVVTAARFPPEGARSAGGVRPLMGGFGHYLDRARARTVVAVMIETRAGLADAAAIATTPGIDLVFIGTGDLDLALGDKAEGALEPACETIRATCAAAGIACGRFTGQPTDARAVVAAGYPVSVVSTDIDAVANAFRGAWEVYSGAG